ncbi:MAG: sulfotransferase [Anaerolineae bacterium]|nr:sulfotransferase [Anaerolineae bacterium]
MQENDKNKYIDRPIFVVGIGRSGSTLLYNLLGGHPKLAWFSNFTSRLQWLPQLAGLSRYYPLRQLYAIPEVLKLLIPRPFEGYEIWDTCRPVPKDTISPPLAASDVTEADERRVRKVIAAHLKYQKRERFINKNIRNTYRVEYLDAMFPEARFIHIVRDPLATVASHLNVQWWPKRKIWIDGRVTHAAEWSAAGKDEAILAAHHWVDGTQYLLDRQASFGERFMRLHYEDMVSEPKQTIRTVLDFCGLEWDGEFEKFMETFQIKNMNFKADGFFSGEQVREIKEICEPVVKNLGYEYW